MCIGIPMQVVEGALGMAVCTGRGKTERINLMMVGDQPAGVWILAFNSKALRVLEATEAAEINLALDALEQVMAGDASGVDAVFADLIGDAPQLPPHLQRPQ